MRNALIVLAVVALALLFVAAFNTGVTVDLDYVVGTWTGVSLTLILLVAAGLLFVAGLVGAVLARAACGEQRRKLEKELEATYRRLREAEAALPSRAVAVTAPVAVAAAAGDGAPTAVAEATEAPTAVAGPLDEEAPTMVAVLHDEETSAAVEAPPEDEAPTAATPGSLEEEAPTTVVDSAIAADDSRTAADAGGPADPEPGPPPA